MCDTAGTAHSGRPTFGVPNSGWLETGTLLGDWRIERLIGLGGMGTVYEATHVLIGKRAAIKVVRADMTPQTAERFVREAWVVNQIEHPNIVDIFEIGHLEDKRPYLVMELLHGQNLEQRMEDGRIQPAECIDIIVQICAALQAAHSHNVIHRDLKPANIVLTQAPNGETVVKLVDWGIARVADPAFGERSGTRTISGTLLGTPEHMSPEQARGQNDVDGRADIYALGSIAYEMFLEGPPFTADSVAELLTAHLREPPPPPSDVWPDIPRALEKLLLAMLAKAPEDRPTLADISATMLAVREELAQRRRPAASRSPSLAEYCKVLLPRRRSARSLTYVAALGIAAAALVFGRAASARSAEDAGTPVLVGAPVASFGRLLPNILPPAAAATQQAAALEPDQVTGEAAAPAVTSDAPRLESSPRVPQAARPTPRAPVRRRSVPRIDPDGTIDPFL